QISIFADISAMTLRRRKLFVQITSDLRDRRLLYRWGYPTKLLILKNGTVTAINSLEDGLRILQSWSFEVPESSGPGTRTARLFPKWKRARK
ncbi:Hypothetical predicted protein, partial [Pelobates cultripes]